MNLQPENEPLLREAMTLLREARLRRESPPPRPVRTEPARATSALQRVQARREV